jgi:hypothetical protein
MKERANRDRDGWNLQKDQLYIGINKCFRQVDSLFLKEFSKYMILLSIRKRDDD